MCVKLQNNCDEETKSLRNFAVFIDVPLFTRETSQLYLFLCDCVDFLSLSSSNFRYNIFEHLSYFDRFDISAVQGRTQMRATKNKAGKCK